MTRISQQMIRSRAEHNEGMLSTLEEVALHQQNIEKIEVLGVLCRHLKIIYMQNNLIGKLQNLHKLKELEYLNIAVNNIVKIENLQRCESLQRLDLTVNFIPKEGLLSVYSLEGNYNLQELYLLGNPCADWHGYRKFVIASLPQLKKLDGQEITPTERILANQEYAELKAKLREELIAEGIDPDKAAVVEDDSMEDEEIEEMGYMNEKGEMVRPWTREARILEYRESEQQRIESEEKKKASTNKLFEEAGKKAPPRRDDFPEIKEGERVWQKNEGDFDWSLSETDDETAIVLEVRVGKFMDTSLIKADVQPTYVRLLIKGRLLQLELGGVEVFPDRSAATRSKATGALLVTMPKVDPKQSSIYSQSKAPEGYAAPQLTTLQADGKRGAATKGAAPASKANGEFVIKEARKAVLQTVENSDEDDDDYVPPL